jgi:hypothetical protein
MKKFGLKPFLIKYCRFVEPGQFFHHLRLQERLAALDLRTISIERFEHHPVWQIKLRAPFDAQAKLILGKSYKGHRPACWASGKLIESRLKEELRSILKQLSPQGVKAEEINVVRHGGYFQLVFVWPLGIPGMWRPRPKQPHQLQVSLVVRRWLTRQQN